MIICLVDSTCSLVWLTLVVPCSHARNNETTATLELTPHMTYNVTARHLTLHDPLLMYNMSPHFAFRGGGVAVPLCCRPFHRSEDAGF